MPTPLYLRSDLAPPDFTPSIIRGAYDDKTTNTDAFQLSLVKSGPVGSQDRSAGENTVDIWSMLLTRGIYRIPVAQTISGTVNVRCVMAQNFGDVDMNYHVHIWVSVGSTNALRGTLLSNYAEEGNNFTGFVFSGGHVFLAPQTMTPVDCEAGDHIIVEIGAIARNIETFVTDQAALIRISAREDDDDVTGFGVGTADNVLFGNDLLGGGGIPGTGVIGPIAWVRWPRRVAV